MFKSFPVIRNVDALEKLRLFHSKEDQKLRASLKMIWVSSSCLPILSVQMGQFSPLPRWMFVKFYFLGAEGGSHKSIEVWLKST